MGEGRTLATAVLSYAEGVSAIRKTAAILLCVLFDACGGGTSSSTSIASDIDAVVEKNFPNSVGIELAIYRDGQVLYDHGYGLRDRGLPDVFVAVENFWRLPQPDVTFHLSRGAFAPDADTLFNLASVSKQFTAGAILLLQQDGELSVGDPLSKYFPSFPQGSDITLLHLLQHRRTQMFTPGPFATNVGAYADGWFVASLDQHRYLWHDGALGGFQTINATFPDDAIDIIVLANSGTGLDPYYAIPELFEAALASPR